MREYAVLQRRCYIGCNSDGAVLQLGAELHLPMFLHAFYRSHRCTVVHVILILPCPSKGFSFYLSNMLHAHASRLHGHAVFLRKI